MNEEPGAAAVARVVAYHDRTKHDFRRSARGPGYLDWAHQPDPFRRFTGAQLYRLPFSDDEPTVSYEAIYTQPTGSQPVTAQTLG